MEFFQVQKVWFNLSYSAQCNFVERNNETDRQAIVSDIKEHKNGDNELSNI